jgi:hypothetical protein
MTDVEKRVKRLVYDLARAVERWRERNGGRDPIIVMTPREICDITDGAPAVLERQDDEWTMLGCRVKVVIDTTPTLERRVYLCEEVAVCG